jgi:hypothetical protein
MSALCSSCKQYIQQHLLQAVFGEELVIKGAQSYAVRMCLVGAAANLWALPQMLPPCVLLCRCCRAQHQSVFQ